MSTPTTQLWLREADLPHGLTIQKTASKLFYAVYFHNKFVHQDTTKSECLRWLQDNPAVLNTCRTHNRQQAAMLEEMDKANG